MDSGYNFVRALSKFISTLYSGKHRNFVLVQTNSNDNKESYCCTEPSRLLTKFTTEVLKTEKQKRKSKLFLSGLFLPFWMYRAPHWCLPADLSYSDPGPIPARIFRFVFKRLSVQWWQRPHNFKKFEGPLKEIWGYCRGFLPPGLCHPWVVQVRSEKARPERGGWRRCRYILHVDIILHFLNTGFR
jgi:hypothetical protein